MSYHAQIMNLPITVNMAQIGLKADMITYKEGHRDARHAAAELANAADKRIETLTQALIRCQQWHHGNKWRDGDTEQRAAWEDHLQTINNALNK